MVYYFAYMFLLYSDLIAYFIWSTLFRSINWANPEKDGQTPLHACILSKRNGHVDWNGIETAELLALNGAKIDTLGTSEQAVINAAIMDGVEKDMAGYIMKKYRNL